MLSQVRHLLERTNVVLASTSPRRIEMFRLMGIAPTVVGSDFAEDLPRAAYTPQDFVKTTARGKAGMAFASAPSSAVLVAADTMIIAPATDAQQSAADIIGKPTSKAHARQILCSLRGKTHSVITGVSVLFRLPATSAAASVAALASLGVPAAVVTEAQLPALAASVHAADTAFPLEVDGLVAVEMNFSETTEVRFGAVSDQCIDDYIASGEPMDKAGAYGIQGIGGSFVSGITGCYNNVVGFPLHRFCSYFQHVLPLVARPAAAAAAVDAATAAEANAEAGAA